MIVCSFMEMKSFTNVLAVSERSKWVFRMGYNLKMGTFSCQAYATAQD